MDHEEIVRRHREAAKLFSARTPITAKDLFAGRFDQILKINGTISQPGAHAIIYGERGVGKTSLANIAPLTFAFEGKHDLERLVAPRVACDSTDTFETIWRKIFRGIKITQEHTPVGFYLAQPEVEIHSLSDELQNVNMTPGEVLNVLEGLSLQCELVVTIDEFDRLTEGEPQRLIADLIKSLSDNQVNATIVLVGVGDSISQLVKGHESVGRHLVEIPLPRMSRSELEKIVLDRLPQLDLEIDQEALSFVSLICAGLPYYTHLLCQHAVCAAISDETSLITHPHIKTAMKKAINDSEREMKSSYFSAIQSRQPNSSFATTLAACALAEADEFGNFTAADVREPLGRIRGEYTDIPAFSSHLERFCKVDKGTVLQQIGQKHQRRYRFKDPLMQPFVIIRSLDEEIISQQHIS